jgi:hypothetical protein
MFTKDDILARLQNGESMDTIASEMADMLNAAKEEKDALDAQKKESDRVEKAKEEAALVMLDGLSDYLVATGNEELQKEIVNVDVRKVVESLDQSMDLVTKLLKLRDLEFEDIDSRNWDALLGAFGWN